MELDQSILSTVNMADLADTPYLRYGIPVAESVLQGAIAAEFSMHAARPGATVALQINQVILPNDTAGALTYLVSIATAADIATAGLAGLTQMIDFAAEQAGTLRPSNIVSGSHTGFVGNSIQVFQIPANTTVIWELPKPGIMLYGNDPGGVPGLLVTMGVVNTALRAGFVAREWPLPG